MVVFSKFSQNWGGGGGGEVKDFLFSNSKEDTALIFIMYDGS